MRSILYLHKIVPLIVMGGLLPAADVTIFEEDFEDSETTFFPGNAALTETAFISDPGDGSRGTVLEISLNGSNRWGGLTDSEIYPLTSLGVAAGANFTYSADVYIPSTTALADNDRTGLIIRFLDETANFGNRIEDNNFPLYVNVGGMPKDEWINVTLTGQVPATDGGGADITQIQPLISVDDVNARPKDDPRDPVSDGVTFVPTVLYDNVKFVAEVPDEDPSLEANPASKFGTISPGGPVSATYIIKNLGASNNLVISAGNITGADASAYTLVTEFPLTIPPTSETTIEVSFDSSQPAGSYSANLDLTTNDVSDPTFTLDLSSLIFESNSESFIVNGSFETGNTTGFASASPFEVVAGTPELAAQDGDFYAAFTITAGARWGNFELNQDISPPAVEGKPTEILITPEMIGQPYRFSCWCYFPEIADGGPNDEDNVTMILRWNGDLYISTGPWDSATAGTYGRGQWVEFIEEGIVPDIAEEEFRRGGTDGQSAPTTSARLIFSVQDVYDPNADPVDPLKNTTDTVVYVDNMSFTVDVPVVELPVYPEITVFARENTDGSSTLTWTSEPGNTYRIELSTDLEPDSWLELEEEYPALDDSETTSWTDTSSAGVDKRFYRVIWNEAPAPPADE